MYRSLIRMEKQVLTNLQDLFCFSDWLDNFMLHTEDEEDFKGPKRYGHKVLTDHSLTANAKLSDAKPFSTGLLILLVFPSREHQLNPFIFSAIGVLYYRKITDVCCYGTTSTDVGITLSAKKLHLSSRVEDKPGSATNRIILRQNALYYKLYSVHEIVPRGGGRHHD